MSLTGWALSALLVTLSLAAFGALVWFWPRLGGRSPQAVAARAGALLGVIVLVLATTAVRLNAQYLFFADWKDLGGAASRQQATVAAGGEASAAAGTVLPGVRTPAGHRWAAYPSGPRAFVVHGVRSGITAPVLVDLPAGYVAGVRSGHVYPVVETFGGYPSSPSQWVRAMRLPQVLARAVAARRIGPAVIVSPVTELPAGTDTECVDGGRGRAAVETWLAQDVPAWAEQTFGVSRERSGWAAVGLSEGGWCAAMAAMLHPAQYSAAVVMGGYLAPDFGPLYRPFAPGSAAARRYDLVALAHRRPPPVALWLETSPADPLSYASSSALIRRARAPLSVTAVVLPDAGHRISVWRGLLPQAVTWLGAHVPGFGPGAGGAQRVVAVAPSRARAITW